jgi:hypothetical protein
MARQWLLEAVEACRATSEIASAATALKHLGLVAMHGQPPDLMEATRLLEESLRLRRSLHDDDGAASCLNDLAVMALHQGELARSAQLLEQGLMLCRKTGSAYGLSFVLKNLSEVALLLGDFGRAGSLLVESVELGSSLGSREGVGCALTGLASLAAAMGEPTRAARLWGASEALREAIDVPLSDWERAAYDRFLTLAREQMGATTWAAHVEDGRALTMERAVTLALEAARGPLTEVE